MRARPGVVAWLSLACLAASIAHAEPSADPNADLPQVENAEPKAVAKALEHAALLPDDDFCRNRPAFLPPRARELCVFAGPAAQRCPAFRAACLGPSPTFQPRREFGLLGRVLGVIGYLLLFALAAGALLGLFVLLRRLLAQGSPPPTVETIEPASPGPAPPPQEQSAVERNVQRRLAKARELAVQGAYPAALAELHAAVVFALDARGLIAASKGRTNGDYARELAEQPQLSASFRELARAVESVQFGARTADRSLFERLLERSAALVGPGVLSLALLLGLSLTGCNRRAPLAGSTAAACGTSADGYSFLCTVLEESRGARRRHRGVSELDSKVGVLVILSDLNESDAEAVSDWVWEGGTALLTRPLQAVDGELAINRSGPPCVGEFALEGASPADPKLVVSPGPTVQGAALRVYARCGNGIIAGRAALGDGSVVVLPRPALLSNASLAAGSNAELLLRLIPSKAGAVEIVGDWTGRTAESPFASLKSAGLLPWLAHISLLAFAFARYRGTPFARRHAPRENPRRRFVEHVKALGDRWADARASRVALSAYATWALESLRGRSSAVGYSNLSDLSEALSSKTGGSAVTVLRTLAKARLAQGEGDDGASEAEHLDTLRELSHLISETGGSRWT